MGKDAHSASGLLPGTLDMLILKTLSARGAMHGYGIAQHIQQVSNDVLQVGEGSLYPALQRLLLNDWVAAEWGQSDNNRRTRFYKLTPPDRKTLLAEKAEHERIIKAVGHILQ